MTSAGSSTNGNDLGISADQIQKLLNILQKQQNTGSSGGNASVAASKLSSNFAEKGGLDEEGKCSYYILTNNLNKTQNTWILDT